MDQKRIYQSDIFLHEFSRVFSQMFQGGQGYLSVSWRSCRKHTCIFGVPGDFSNAVLYLTTISLSLNCSPAHSLVTLFTCKLENVLMLEQMCECVLNSFFLYACLLNFKRQHSPLWTVSFILEVEVSVLASLFKMTFFLFVCLFYNIPLLKIKKSGQQPCCACI